MEGLGDNNNQSTSKGKNGLVLPLALVGLLLAGSVGYNIYQANQVSTLEKNESLNSQILKNETGQKDQVRRQYDSILNDYTQYKARIEDRNNLLGDKEKMIQLKNQDIQQILDKDNPTPEEMNKARKMINDLETHKKERTIRIYISHRMASCTMCDYIYVLDQGEVVQEGSFNDLVNENGKFLEMWEKQSDFYKKASI